MGFEAAIPVFKRAKTVHAADHAATVIGNIWNSILLIADHSDRDV
jgi:hypothetical protein